MVLLRKRKLYSLIERKRLCKGGSTEVECKGVGQLVSRIIFLRFDQEVIISACVEWRCGRAMKVSPQRNLHYEYWTMEIHNNKRPFVINYPTTQKRDFQVPHQLAPPYPKQSQNSHKQCQTIYQ